MRLRIPPSRLEFGLVGKRLLLRTSSTLSELYWSLLHSGSNPLRLGKLNHRYQLLSYGFSRICRLSSNNIYHDETLRHDHSKTLNLLIIIPRRLKLATS